MSLATDEITLVEGRLEVTINQVENVFDSHPSLLRLSSLMTTLQEVFEAVAVAADIKEGRRPVDDAPPPPNAPSMPWRHLPLAIRREMDPSQVSESVTVRVSKISMNSPLVMELVTTGVGGAGVVSAVVYLFRNPGKVGEWFPKLQTSWYNGRTEAEKARRAFFELRNARTEMRELE
ncbi:hypothetical protein [Streptosporangium sp. NPDC002524]|uniref:hypothetical protein n=1 Tax=Streptosporangium sp. NPDC002524 TaxID=3154537 RepID=UPI00331EC887